MYSGRYDISHGWPVRAAGLALGLFGAGCAHPEAPLDGPERVTVDVIIVPGCPNEVDGHLSTCQWRRAVWAAHLYELGIARTFITSGAAAYTPYIEAESIARGMEVLGVPHDRVFRETQALHTDQNAGYAIAIAERLGFSHLGMASDPGQTEGMCSMAARWGWDCASFPMDYAFVDARIADGLPEVRVAEVPNDEWIAHHREPRMATSAHYNSIAHYTGVILKATFTGSRPPKPPVPEPTLADRVGLVAPPPQGGG